MRRIGSGVAVGLEVGEQRPQGGQLAADGAVGLFVGGQGVPPGGDVLGADSGELLPGPGLDADVGEKLVEVALIGVTPRNGKNCTLRLGSFLAEG